MTTPLRALRQGAPRRSLPAGANALVGLVAAVCLLQVIWYLRFRSGSIVDLDEASFIAHALSDVHGLGRGPVEFARSVIVTDTVGPFVPATTVPFLLLFGESLGAAWAMTGVYLALLVVATYALARRLVSVPWALIAALVVGTAPVVSDYSRIYHFAVPAAVLLTTALWCLLRSDRLLERRFAIIAGALVGFMILTRIMTLAYLPGLAVGLGAQVLIACHARRQRAANYGLFWLVTAIVAAPWWIANFDTASSYLTNAGYGSEAQLYGKEYSISSPDYWLKELRIVGDYLFAPLLLVVLACFAGGAIAAIAGRARQRRADVRAWVRSDAFLLAVVVAEGYVVLSSSAVEGSAYSLPWLPSLVILAVAVTAALPLRAVRITLAVALVGAVLFNVAVKNGVSSRLSAPASASLPILGEILTKDGRDRIYQMLDAIGYDVPSPPARLPDMHREWLPLNRRLVTFMNRYARARGREPRVTVATGDWALYDARLYLASELWADRRLAVGTAAGGATLDAYRSELAEIGTNFVMTSDPPEWDIAGINQLAVLGAMLQLRFRTVLTTRAPDGRRVMLWWRDAPGVSQER